MYSAVNVSIREVVSVVYQKDIIANKLGMCIYFEICNISVNIFRHIGRSMFRKVIWTKNSMCFDYVPEICEIWFETSWEEELKTVDENKQMFKKLFADKSKDIFKKKEVMADGKVTVKEKIVNWLLS